MGVSSRERNGSSTMRETQLATHKLQRDGSIAMHKCEQLLWKKPMQLSEGDWKYENDIDI